MFKKNFPLLFALSTLLAAMLACNITSQGPSPDDLNQTQIALGVQMTIMAQQQADATSPANATTPPQTSSAPPAPTATPTVTHITRPDEQTRVRTWVSDVSSAALAPEKRAIGDSLATNLLERPFTANEMEYRPYLDLTRVDIGEGGEWLYVTLYLEGTPPEDSTAFYAIEIDIDRDGRGDWLIGGMVPPESTWTTDRVKVLRDTDNDVGGKAPMAAEAPLAGLNGYEEQVFDAGQGADPDAAWIRRDPQHPDRVQLAFKFALLQSNGTFLWNGWSDEGVQRFDWFDYNDHFTLEAAGSPQIGNDHYPLAALPLVDNTCRWSYGFEPTTAYPGLCPLPTPTPTATAIACTPPPNGCPLFYFGNQAIQYIWNEQTCQCEAP